MTKRNARPWMRIATAVLLVCNSSSCTHLPSGKKAFNNFNECFAANAGLAALGGIGVGAFTAALTKHATGDNRAATGVGVAAGGATAVVIGMTAWRKCAAVYTKSEMIAAAQAPRPSEGATHKDQMPSGLYFDRLDMRVEGGEDSPPVPEFEYSYRADDANAKDIPAKFRHKIEIVRFTATEDDKLVLADASGQPLRDSSGKLVPFEMASSMPRGQLAWETIAADGKDNVEQVVIQQGTNARYQFVLPVPPRAKLALPLPVPMRYTLTIEVAELKSSRTVDFAILATADRPKRFASSALPSEAGSTAAPTTVASRGLPKTQATVPQMTASMIPVHNDFLATHTVKRTVSIYNDSRAERKIIGVLPQGTPVRIEQAKLTKVGESTVRWTKVVTQTGTEGWLRAREVTQIR